MRKIGYWPVFFIQKKLSWGPTQSNLRFTHDYWYLKSK